MAPRPKKQFYGVDVSEEHKRQELVRDIRSPIRKIRDVLITRQGFLLVGILVALSLLILPAFWPFQFGVYIILCLLRRSKTSAAHLPVRVPDIHCGKDYGELPASGKYGRAAGKFYIGNVYDGTPSVGQELWASPNDLLTHMMILGTTGSGKTETLVSLAFNYLALGSGFIYVDPKAAPKLVAQLYTMCRILGRDDDFLVINFAADKAAQETLRTKGYMRNPVRETNTQNPFGIGTANQLCQLLFAMMPGGDEGGANEIFSKNAQAVISGLLFVLVEMRDKGIRPLSIELLRHYLMDFNAVDELARSSEYSRLAITALHSGLANVGWNKSLKTQSDTFNDQFQYAKAYFGQFLSLLADNYGRQYNVSHGEVDPVDVILGRRVFLINIPSMDKDTKELKSLGQLSLATVKNACAVGLGDTIQGSLKKVLGSLPTACSIPFGITVDEFGAIAMPGFEIVLTQGRGLGIAATIANQDWAGMMRASKEVAGQMLSNTKLKFIMTCVDPLETRDLAEKLFGKAVVMQTGGFSIEKGSSTDHYRDSLNASAQQIDRVDFTDLQQQVEGEFHLSFKGRMIRGKMFYADPPLKDTQQVKLAYQLKVNTPDVTTLRATLGDIRTLKDALRSILEKDLHLMVPEPSEDIRQLMATFSKFADDVSTPRSQVGIEALMNFSLEDQNEEPPSDDLEPTAEIMSIGDEPDLSNFAMVDDELRTSLEADGTSPLMHADLAEEFDGMPVADLKEDFVEIGLASGLNADEAERTAAESEQEINAALTVAYAPPLPVPESEDINGDLAALVESMEMLPSFAASENVAGTDASGRES